MAELIPHPFERLVSRQFRELRHADAIFDLPRRKFFLGDRQRDLSVPFHSHVAATPLGPAAGPQSQLAQNIVLSWLGGSRIIELKTVQIQDELRIPRPCIDMRTVGYNVEWSQELKLEQSLEEYVKASMLIDMLVASGELDLVPGFDRVVYDMSVGYDLKGIQSPRVQAFIRGMLDATPVIERLRRQIPEEYAHLRDLPFRNHLSDTLTLSTFHGCPPDEIEGIIDFLLRDVGLHCIIKLNPMLLGPDEVRHLLHDVMGYDVLHVPDTAFTRDTQWNQAVGFLDRLRATARARNLGLGVKCTNTLIVENSGDFLPASEKESYLSGPPLHVLAMHLVQRLRRRFGTALPISFSAGIDRLNFPDAVSLGLVPITVCTDLLRPGGYARQAAYFRELLRRMENVGATRIGDFVIRSCTRGVEALENAGVEPGLVRDVSATAADLRAIVGDETYERWVAQAALLNTEEYVAKLAQHQRYHRTANSIPPKKVGSVLELFDCLTCDKCIPVCPNDANFVLSIPPCTLPIRILRATERGWEIEQTGDLVLSKKHQIANFADFCNECGNCDVFCPEDGGPYILKPRFFGSQEAFRKLRTLDGFYVELREGERRIWSRFEGREFSLRIHDEQVVYAGDDFQLRFQAADLLGTLTGHADRDVDLIYYSIMDVVCTALVADDVRHYMDVH